MSAFAGIVSLDGRPLERHAEDRVAVALTAMRPGRTSAWRSRGAIFVHKSSEANKYSEAGRPAFRDSDALFTALARIDNREELGDALGLGPTELAQTSDAELIQRLFLRWGDCGVARCVGAFAFAHWDAAARRLTLGRDCLGNRPLFYHRGPEFVCFATTLGALLALPGVPRAIDEIALAQFIAVNNGNERRTFYRDIERVRSCTLVTIDRNGINDRRYWAPDLDAAPPYRRDEDYIERARELFDAAVAAATRDTPHLAIATSGGLDSSAIAATAARQGIAASISCFCLVPPPGTNIDVGRFKYLDERDKVEALGQMYPGLRLHFVAPERVHPKAFDDTRHFVGIHLPAFDAAGLGFGPYLPETVLATGHRAMLIGNYGNFGLTWWGRLSLVDLFQGRQWRSLLRDLQDVARQSDRGLARTMAADLFFPLAPHWTRRLIHRLRGKDPDSVAQYCVLNPTFIAETGLARSWRAQGFDPWFGVRDWNAKRLRAYRLFDHNQYARDVRGLAEETSGLEIRDPHGDRRLLEFALSVPEPMYRRDGIPRSFARRVLADRLPAAILSEQRRGANTPTWFRTLDARRSDITADIDRLDASPLAKRLLDLPRLKRLVAQWPNDANEAQKRKAEYRSALARGVHVGRFIRWVEGGNA